MFDKQFLERKSHGGDFLCAAVQCRFLGWAQKERENRWRSIMLTMSINSDKVAGSITAAPTLLGLTLFG